MSDRKRRWTRRIHRRRRYPPSTWELEQFLRLTGEHPDAVREIFKTVGNDTLFWELIDTAADLRLKYDRAVEAIEARKNKLVKPLAAAARLRSARRNPISARKARKPKK